MAFRGSQQAREEKTSTLPITNPNRVSVLPHSQTDLPALNGWSMHSGCLHWSLHLRMGACDVFLFSEGTFWGTRKMLPSSQRQALQVTKPGLKKKTSLLRQALDFSYSQLSVRIQCNSFFSSMSEAGMAIKKRRESHRRGNWRRLGWSLEERSAWETQKPKGMCSCNTVRV